MVKRRRLSLRWAVPATLPEDDEILLKKASVGDMNSPAELGADEVALDTAASVAEVPADATASTGVAEAWVGATDETAEEDFPTARLGDEADVPEPEVLALRFLRNNSVMSTPAASVSMLVSL